MKKRIFALLTAATLSLSVMPAMNVSAANVLDYEARNFVVTDNGNFWEGCAQISWFNPAVAPTKVSLYASGPKQTEGNYVLLGEDYDTTANASVVTTLPTKNWAVTPRNADYNFKLVMEFADGKTTTQTVDAFVPNDSNNNWSISTQVSDDFKTIAQRGGWCYNHSEGHDFFPMGTNLVYEDGDPALKIWSNAHIKDHEDETRDEKTFNSGNYYGTISLYGNIESGSSYDVSFRYKAKGIELASIKIGEGKMVEDTNDEWLTFNETVTADTNGSLAFIELKVGNEAIIIDDVVVKKTGTEENLLSDGDFSNLAASAPDDVKKASKTENDGKLYLTWEDSANIEGVNVYKVEKGVEVKKAFVKKNTQSITFEGTTRDSYVLKAVNSKNVESDGVDCEIPTYSGYELAATDVITYPTGKSGELAIAWKNSSCAGITDVLLKNSKGETIASASAGNFEKTPDARCIYKVAGLEDFTYEDFKIVTVSDQGTLEQPVSGATMELTAGGYTYDYDLTDDMKVHWQAQDSGNSHFDGRSEVVTENGNTFLKIYNYCTAHRTNCWFELTQIANREDLGFQPSTQYTITLRYKGSGYAWQKVYIHDQGRDLGGVDLFTSKQTLTDWTQFSKTFKTDSGAATQGIRFVIENPTDGPLWIDDIVIKETATGKVMFTEDFENIVGTCETTFENITTESKDGSVKLSWTAPGMNSDISKTVRVYAETEGEKYLAAILSPFAESVEIKNLKNNQEYTFTFDSVDMHGFVSEPVSVKASPKAPAYKVSSVELLDKSGNSVDKLSAGEYSASAYVKNNGMGNDFTAQVIVCLYEGDTLYAAQCSDVETIAESDWKKDPTHLTTGTITVPNNAKKDYSVKIYVWDSIKGMTKLADTSEF